MVEADDPVSAVIGDEILGLFFGFEGDQFVTHRTVEFGADDVVGLFGGNRFEGIKVGNEHLLDLRAIVGEVPVEDIVFHHIFDPVEVVGLAVYDHFGGPLGVFGDKHSADGALGPFGDIDLFTVCGVYHRPSGLQKGHQRSHFAPVQRRAGFARFDRPGNGLGAFTLFGFGQLLVIAEP